MVHLRATSGLRIGHYGRFDVVPLYTDLGRKFITFFLRTIGNSGHYLQKLTKVGVFRVYFNIPSATDIIPIYWTQSKCGIVLGGWRAVIVYFRYYRDISTSTTALIVKRQQNSTFVRCWSANQRTRRSPHELPSLRPRAWRHPRRACRSGSRGRAVGGAISTSAHVHAPSCERTSVHYSHVSV